jgi:nitrite reductase (NO-forming)
MTPLANTITARDVPVARVARRGRRRRVIGEKAPVPVWPKSAVRVAFGLIWAVDAAFKWRSGFRHEFLHMIKQAGEGQPAWLHWWFSFWSGVITPHPQVWAYGIAVVETLIALAIIFGFARKVTYVVTILIALLIWGVAEGFGGPYSASSTDIGAACIYAVVGFALLVLNLETGSSRYSVDYLIEKRVSWWHWIAEFGAHNHPAPGERARDLPTPAFEPAPAATMS